MPAFPISNTHILAPQAILANFRPESQTENSRNLAGISTYDKDSIFDAQSYVKLIIKPKDSKSSREKSISNATKRRMVRTCSMTDAIPKTGL